MRLTKTLLAAAVALGATVTTAKAYDLYGSDWNYTQPDKRDSGWTFVGSDFNEIYWLGSLDTRLVNAGVYRNATARLDWRDNYYSIDATPEPDYARGRLGTGVETGPTTASFDYFTPAQDGNYESGYYSFDTSPGTTNIAIGQYYVGLGVRLDGDFDTDVIRAITVFERTVQVARTGSGDNGATAFTAFESDNDETLSTTFYNSQIVGRNVLPIANAVYDGEGLGNYASASFVNGSFEINTAGGITQENLSDAEFNAAMTGVVATERVLNRGEVDIYAPSFPTFGGATDGNSHISITSRNDSVALALNSTLVEGENYNLLFDFKYSGLAPLTSDSPIYVYGSSTAGGYDTLLATLAAGSDTGIWLTADLSFVAGANIDYIGIRGESTLDFNSWIALDNFRFATGVIPVIPTQLAGSVVRTGDIALGFNESEGLFSKDGGWLDIRGDLTLGAGGTIYIRDGEITSNVYTQFYAPGTLDPAGELAIESGILSVRSHFAQDMAVAGNQTLGFRDGAVNDSRLYLDGFGYGFDGEGWGDPSNGGGALRSITGENVQNGNVSIISDGEGFGGAVIGVDLGSHLTLNGAINGLNSLDSNGGANLGFNSVGNTVVNGVILSGITDIYKASEGELLITSANLFTGDVYVEGGSLRITNSGALAGNSGATYVSEGASLVLDQSEGLSLVDDIYILGTGMTGVGGAIHNKSGANVTTGDVIVGFDGVGDFSATITVAASSSLTVGSIDSGDPFDYHTLTVDVDGVEATEGAFTATGNTGTLDRLVKNGSGLATLTTLSNDFDTATVNGGKLVVLGSESTLVSPFDANFVKDGVGTAEFRGSHFYEDFDVLEGTLDLVGNVTLVGPLDNDGFQLGGDGEPLTSATFNVESGATLTHISSDGEGGSFTNGFDIYNASVLNVKAGGTVQLNDAEIDLWDNGKVSVAGTLSTTDGISANNQSTLEILSGGVVNANVYATDSSSTSVNSADGEGLDAGVLNGNVFANANASITLGGVINGDVTTDDAATLTLLAGSVHNGDYIALGSSDVVINGSLDNDELNPFGQNFSISEGARLSGSGTIGGDLTQTGGTVAPGNSTDVLTVLGDYNVNAGVLQIEIGGIDGPGNDPTGNDQLAIAGSAIVGGTAILQFQDYNGFESSRRDVFQVLATDTGAPIAVIGGFNTVDMTALQGRILFDHSTGKAYGTGLSLADTETFRDYGSNANRREIGRALWMESIARDNNGLVDDENFDAFAINAGETGQTGLKAFIQTRDAGVLDATQVQTDLGAAAVSILTAPDVGAALDALSPEAYVGITELGVRVTRNFAQLPASKRKLAAANEWDFSVGYAGEQITAAAGQTGFTNYKVSSDQINLTAARDLSKNLRLTLAAGLDDGKVGAAGFSADTDTQAFAIGLGFTPDSKGWTADLGVSLTRTDWDASRNVAQTSGDNEDGLGVALRVSLAPTVDGALSYAPYIGLSYATQDQSAVAEGGADNDGMVGVGFAGYERDSLVSEVGLKAEYALKPGTTLTGVVAWEHEFEDSGETTLDAEFTEDGVSDTRFAVTSAGFGADIFRVGLGVRVELGAKSALSFGYDALLSSDSKSGQGVKADVSFRF